jgi:hypothetical protein
MTCPAGYRTPSSGCNAHTLAPLFLGVSSTTSQASPFVPEAPFLTGYASRNGALKDVVAPPPIGFGVNFRVRIGSTPFLGLFIKLAELLPAWAILDRKLSGLSEIFLLFRPKLE